MRWMMIAIALMACGCAGTPGPASDPLGVAPADLTLDLWIRPGAEAAERSEVHLRPGRFVLFPNGAIHYGMPTGRDADTSGLPPRVRTISRQDLAEIWGLLEQTGLADRQAASEPRNFDLIVPPAGGLTYLLGVQGGGDRWAFVRSSTEGDPPDPAMTSLIRRLAELAWATDIPEEEIAIIPRRYEFGPDPYARYRGP